MLHVTMDAVIYQLQARGGISRLYSELLPRMCAQDPALRVEMLSTAAAQTLPQHPQISLRRMPSIRGGLLPRPALAALNGALRQQAIGLGVGRVWHSTYFTRPRLWKGAQVVTVYDMIPELYPHLFDQPAEDAFRALKRRCVLDADLVISISDVTRQDIHRLYGVDLAKIVTVPLACSDIFQETPESDIFQETPEQETVDAGDPRSLALLPGKPFFLYVGRRSHHKNFAGLARAYAAWPGRKDVDLVVAGDPWTTEEAAQMPPGIRENLHWVGAVSDRELSRLYRRAAAFVYPSLYEGFGIPLLEAMACGCPVVASSIPSTLEIAGSAPLYFDLDAPESFVQALESAKREGRNTARAFEAQAQARRYSWAATAAQTLDVYRLAAGTVTP